MSAIRKGKQGSAVSGPDRRIEPGARVALHAPLKAPPWIFSPSLNREERRGLLVAQRLVDKGEAEWLEGSER
ncbi:MAG: hypothetical protein AABM42_01890 [Actinomycetota bacterium]